MKLEQSFTVPAPVDRVWAALIDVERIAPCLPGAEITGRDDSGAYEGTFSVKLGPTTAAYRGSLRMEAVDEAARTATMSAKGTDKRGQGGASATIVSTMREEGGETHVDVLTDFHITGRLARFGRSGMIEDISKRLMREFAQCLQSTLGAEPAAAAVAPAVPPDDAGAEPAAAAAVPPDDAGAERAAAAAAAPPAETPEAPAAEPPAAAAPVPPDDAGAAPEATAAEPAAPPSSPGAGDVPAEAAGGAPPSADPAATGTLGVPSPSEPARQPPGTTGGAGGHEGVTEGPGAGDAPDPAEAAVASAGGAAAEAATAGAAPPGAADLADGPAAPAPPPDAGTTPPPPPGGPGGVVPTAGGAGGTPPPPLTGPPPPPGGRPRHADTPAETPAEAAPTEAAPPDAAPAEPAPRTGSVPPPGRPDSAPEPEPAKPIGGVSLFFSVLWERIKRRFSRSSN